MKQTMWTIAEEVMADRFITTLLILDLVLANTHDTFGKTTADMRIDETYVPRSPNSNSDSIKLESI